MGSNRRKTNGGKYRSIPDKVLDSASLTASTRQARWLLLRILRNYNGYNNGNLTATWQEMEPYFNSQETVRRALKSLIENRIIEITGTGTTSRKGGKPPILYAVTWAPIHEYRGKGLMTAKPTIQPIRQDWPKAMSKKSPSPKTGAKRPTLTPVISENQVQKAKSIHPKQVRVKEAANDSKATDNSQLKRVSG